MMDSILKKIIVFYVALALIASPIQLLAAHKKTHKRISVSQKHAQKKHPISSRYKKRVNVKLHNTPTLQTHKIVEDYDGSGILQLASSKALIVNQNTGEVIYAKNTGLATPIASITKLMTAMVMLDAKQPFDEMLYVSDDDVDYVKSTSSRLSVGAGLSRGDMLQLALMASENRAASAIGHNLCVCVLQSSFHSI